MTQTPQTPPGWYITAEGVERWWNGEAWTETVRATPQSAPAPMPTKAITKQPVHTNHVFHLIMTLLTCGLWGLFVWLPMTILNSLRREKVVTRYR